MKKHVRRPQTLSHALVDARILTVRGEKVMLDAARAPGFNLQKIKEAMAAMERVS